MKDPAFQSGEDDLKTGGLKTAWTFSRAFGTLIFTDRNPLPANELAGYCRSCLRHLVLGEKVWEGVNSWKYFEKDTLGKQLVRSADSVAANISEGFGRYPFAISSGYN